MTSECVLAFQYLGRELFSDLLLFNVVLATLLVQLLDIHAVL